MAQTKNQKIQRKRQIQGMIDLFLELVKTHGLQIWVGLCVFVLIVGFALCAGNPRRQLLIALFIILWGINTSFHEEFYNAPIARYFWFPYWVTLQGAIILFIYHLEKISKLFCCRYHLEYRAPSKDELIQEAIVAIALLLLCVLDVLQLGSALYGMGRATASYYDDACRLFGSLAVIAMIIPSKNGLQFIKESLSEKVVHLVARRSGSHRSINKL